MHRVWVLIAFMGIGCHAKDEASQLVGAVDAYRAASNDAKPEKAKAIDAVACTDEEVCKAKDACRKSADATAKGLALQSEIQDAIKDGGKADPDTMQKKFEESNSDLAEGYGYLDDCRAKVQHLRDRFGI
ncbi:MAG TPA: hypothetical protein VGH28_18225 [Polyangiaceae bacterium]